jgi:hypothetical protein
MVVPQRAHAKTYESRAEADEREKTTKRVDNAVRGRSGQLGRTWGKSPRRICHEKAHDDEQYSVHENEDRSRRA